jgi:hypothetical protein
MMQSMRSTRSILAIPMSLGLALAALTGLSVTWGTAWAQTGSPAAEVPAAEAPAAEVPAAEVPAAEAPAAEALETDPAEEPGTVMREPERLQYKPSGFWTSGRPAVGGAYRYRLLGIGVVVLVITGAITIWVVRRHPARHA